MDIPHLQCRVVTNPEDVADFWDWLTHRPKGYVACDTETGAGTADGNPLDVFQPGFHVRMMQFGDLEGGWAIPMQGWPSLVEGAFDWIKRSRTVHIWHNGFTYDYLALSRHGIWLDPTTMEDTQIYARLGGYSEDPKDLKGVAEMEFGGWAGAGSRMLKEGMKNAGWNWTTVPIGWQPYPVYGVTDTCLTAMLWEKWIDRRIDYAAQHQLEIAAAMYTNHMTINGMMVDGAYLKRTIDKYLVREQELLEQCKAMGWGKPSQDAEVRRILSAAGVLDDERTTAGGLISIDKKQLLNVDHPLARLVLDYRRTRKIAHDYLDKIWKQAGRTEEPALIHPSIWSMEARTHRMCLPDSHRLLTRRGVLPIEQVVVGDETLSDSGEWVTINAVHRYADQPTVKWDGRSTHLESTAEHRWVNYMEHDTSNRLLEPLAGKRRRIVQLAPEVELFDFDRRDFSIKTETERMAAIVGLLVSDGRMYNNPTTGRGIDAYIYQTEGKFYQQFKELIPDEGISYDRITANTKQGSHHEIRLRTRWLRPRLEAMSLVLQPGELLKNSPDLIRWVTELPVSSVHMFLQAVWMADGSVTNKSRKISCGSANLRDALQLAAYRCGYRSSVFNSGMGGWSTKDRLGVVLQSGQVHTRYLAETAGQADVWCVTTSSGTFTAWGPDGPYLTGNSASNPPVQQFPANDPTVRNAFIPRQEDHIGLSADYGQIEMRGWAALNKDQALLDTLNEADRTGEDFFVLMARQLFGEPDFQKSDKRRGPVKNTCVPLDTRILTQRGWLAHDEVIIGDQTIGYNDQTGMTEWTTIRDVMHYDDAPITQMSTKTWKVSCTPEHRWATTSDRHRADPAWQTADELSRTPGKRRRILLAAQHDGPGYAITDTEAALLGWALSDGDLRIAPLNGSTSQGSDGRRQGVYMEIRQSKHTAEIDRLIKEIPCRVVERGDSYKVYTFEFSWARDLCRRVGLLTPDGQRPSFSLLASGFSASQREAALQAMRLADGMRSLYTSDEWTRDLYRAMVFMSGNSVRTHVRMPDGKGWMRKPNYEIRALLDGVTTQKMTWLATGREQVWCVRTDLGSWTMSQGGLDMITGNSYATIYAGGENRIAETAGLPVSQVQPIIRGLRQLYRSFADTGMSMVMDDGDGRAHVTTPSGRTFQVREWGDQRKLPNYKIQGWAAETLKEALIRCGAAGLGPYMVIPVHDELVFSVPKKDAPEIAEEVKIIMDGVIDPEEYGVAIKASPVTGERWGALKD